MRGLLNWGAGLVEWVDYLLGSGLFRYIFAYSPLVSKKNEVFLIRGEAADGNTLSVVCKLSRKKDPEREFRMLGFLRSCRVRVPQPLLCLGNLLVVEYIEGMSLADLFSADRGPENVRVAEELSRWLAGLHRITRRQLVGETDFPVGCGDAGDSLLMGDVNLKNFLYAPEGIYGLDFEDYTFGNPLQELGRVAAFILANDPGFQSWKYGLVAALARSYEYGAGFAWRQEFAGFVAQGLKELAGRRPRARETILARAEELYRLGKW